MIPLNVQQEIVELSTEDCTPLFEVIGAISAAMPNRPKDEHLRLAQSFVRSLLSKGYIKLCYERWAESKPQRDIQELTELENRAELIRPSNWEYRPLRKDDQPWVAIVATPAGERALIAGEFYSP